MVGDLAARHDLDMVVSGHSHAYEHLVRTIAGRPLHVLITGGAGGGLEKPLAEPISPPDRVIVAHHFIRAVADTDALEIEAVDRDGHLLDRWSIRKDLRCSQSDDDRTRCAGTQM
ncbi:MAG: hypothetical protein ABJC89_00625 [Acidobacteriota bacterium]